MNRVRKMPAPERWMREVVAAAEEIANAMNLGDLRVVGSIPLPSDLPGAYLPIVGGAGASVYMGWLASANGCDEIARKLYGDPNGKLSYAEVVDAMGEIVNIVAGAVKRRMLPHDDTLALGLPIFVDSPIRPLAGRALATQIKCGGVDAVLVLIGNAGQGAKGPDPDHRARRSDA